MTEFYLKKLKDLGLQREVMEALPYAIVRGAWEGSFPATGASFQVMNHIVPTGHQLKILFLRVWTQSVNGAKFSIVQSTPSVGEPGYPVVGSAPAGVVDYPMLESAGSEALHGNLEQPVHVVEGSVSFNVLYVDPPLVGAKYGIVWWGVEKIPEPP